MEKTATRQSRTRATVARRISLTVHDDVDVFHVRRSHVVASFALVAAGLVPHDADDVEVLFSVQRLRCSEGG